jgi:hypothetical protein
MDPLSYLAHVLITPVKKKGWLSGEYVLLADYLSQAQLLYETGAVLGYTYRNNLQSFAAVFTQPDRNVDLIYFLTTATGVADRLAALPEEPKNFYDLFFKSEAQNLLATMHKQGSVQSSELAQLPQVAKLKMPLKYYLEHLRMTALEGIQLGSHFSDLANKLFSYEYEADQWRFAYKAGLDVGPLPPKYVPLTEREVDARNLIRPYVEEVHPELLAELGL